METPPDQQTPPDLTTSAFLSFLEKVKGLPTPEERISFGLEFMRMAISQEGSPHFREFWEARKIVLPFFRENINLAIRSRLWDEYVELTQEARKLKDILEEQSAFATEQIELAIAALEKELSQSPTLLTQGENLQFPSLHQLIETQKYNAIQKELNLLNTFASRLNALRKEIIKTDMRIRFKTKFIKRLSQIGDQVFPKRRDLIDAISADFEKDVDLFVERYFKEEQILGAPYYAIREEIKEIQGMAKILTLNSAVFSRTRLKLSSCWDQIRALEKEYKKETQQKKQVSAELKEEERLQEQKIRELQEIEREKLRLKREKLSQFKEAAAFLLKEGAKLELEDFSLKHASLLEEWNQLDLTKMDKQPLERILRNLRDLLAERKEHSLIHLSEDDLKALENYRTVFQQKKERRQEIRQQLEAYRKTLGASGLDFEKAMHYRELVDQEKERLDKVNTAIEEIEQKIQELEGSA